jgi:hypothetical protein
MRKRSIIWGFIHCILAVLVTTQAIPLLAADGPAAGAGNAAMTAATMAAELEAMKVQIDNQQKQIERLQAMLAQQQPAGSADTAAQASNTQKINELDLVKGELQAVADSTAEANQRITKIETSSASYNKSNDAKIKQLGNFTFSGDIRARFETFLQGAATDRNRERFRLRFNVAAKINDEFNAGFSLATGSLDDPVSTNQTMTGFLNRKSFGIDKAFLQYKPKYAKFLKLDAGKFSFPWYRTAMTFDNDVNPEGFAQTMSFDIKSSSSPLRNFTIVGFQLPINENSGGPDSFIIGGQIQTQWKLGSKAKLGLYGSGINFLRTDPLGVAAAARTAGTLVGSLNNSNTLRKNASGTVIGYGSKFAYLDAIMKLDLDTSPRFPTSILFNFVNNVRGPHSRRSGYWTELNVGRQKEAKDLQFGYMFTRIEKDAVISAFNESDIRSSTNVINHKLQVGYMFHSNIQGQISAFIGRLADPLANPELVPAGVRAACTGSDLSNCKDQWLKRVQFDVIYKF